MKYSFCIKTVSLILTLTLILTALSGCKDNKPEDKKAVSSKTESEEISFEEGFKGKITSEFTLDTIKEVEETTGAVEGSEAVHSYKYKLLSGDFCMVKDGKAECQIVVSPEAKTTVTSAANDLALNIEKMTGVQIPVMDDTAETGGNIILIGKNKKTEELGFDIPSGFPENEGFRIVSSKNILLLAGNDEGDFTGTQYAVTCLLKSLGFGWYGPDELWQVVPTAETVIVSECDLVSRPSFGSRYTRINYEAPEIAGRWFLGGYRSEVEHKFGYMFPVSKYYSEHPEYYALSKGTRSTEGKRWWQICLSNPEVQRIVADECIKYFKENPDSVGVSIGQNDGNGDPDSPDYANWCECENCKAFAHNFTEAMMKFANIVGDMVREECPGKTVMYYAYFPTFNAPETDLKASDNVLLMMCKQGGLTRFIRNNNMFNSYMGDVQFSENFNNWKNLGYKHIGIYEWNCPGAASEAWKDAFWVQGEVFLDNAKWFKENGVDFIFIDQGPNPYYERAVGYFDIRWPLWYVNSIGMYNCELSFEDIMRPACDNLFGDAGALMYKFYKKMNDANKNCQAPNTTWGLPGVGEIYTSEYISEIDTVISDALNKAEEIGGDILARVQNQYDNWQLTKSKS